MENNQVPQKLSIEQATYEQLVSSKTAETLATQLNLTEVQRAKANTQLLLLMDNDKLQGATQLSKLRFCYRVATLNYKNANAVAPVKYGTGVQAQLQYQALIEDMLDCGGVVETNAVPLYKGIDYKPFINKWGFKELVLPETIEVKDMFEEVEVIGYYCYAKTTDGRTATSLMSNKQLEDWALRYSISQKKFKKGEAKSSIWNDNFDQMALKTVIRAVARQILKWYPFDRLQKSLALDQVVFTDVGEKYEDNPSNNTSGSKVIKVDEQMVIDQKPEEPKE